jgi:hypothetical protein
MPADQHEFMPIAGRVDHEAVALADGTALVAGFRRIPVVPLRASMPNVWRPRG